MPLQEDDSEEEDQEEEQQEEQAPQGDGGEAGTSPPHKHANLNPSPSQSPS